MGQPSAAPRRNSSGLVRDISVLELLAEEESIASGGLGVSRIAEMLGRDKTVISRTLATLAEAGLVSRDRHTLGYRLGPRVFALAARTHEATMVRESRPYLRHLAHQVGETTHLSVLRGGSVLTLVSELSPYEFRTAGWEGITTPARLTPAGRVLLADLEEDELAQWFDQHWQDAPREAMPSTVLAALPAPRPAEEELQELRTEIERIRERGYAISDEELEIGVVAASAPVRDYTGRIVAAISLSAPKARVPRPLDRIGAFLVRAARPLSARMGGPDPA